MVGEDGIEMDLDLDAPWRIGEAAFAALLGELRASPVRTLVEFGAGASSFRLAQALPDTRILSIEHDAAFFEWEMAAKRSLPHVPNLAIELRPLRWRQFGPYRYLTYCEGTFPSDTDVVIIDGPPIFTVRGREGCLHQIAKSLRVGTRIFLDDADRPEEASIVANWTRCHGGLRLESKLNVGHGIQVLKTEVRLGRPRMRATVLADNLSMQAILAKRSVGSHAPTWVKGLWRQLRPSR